MLHLSWRRRARRRRLRGRDRLVALIGDWHQGEALIACDPVQVLGPDDDPFRAVDAPHSHCDSVDGFRPRQRSPIECGAMHLR